MSFSGCGSSASDSLLWQMVIGFSIRQIPADDLILWQWWFTPPSLWRPVVYSSVPSFAYDENVTSVAATNTYLIF